MVHHGLTNRPAAKPSCRRKTKRKTLAIESFMRFLLIPLLALAAHGADYQLKATPGTVAWGYYWSAAKPVLRIKSGDRVEIQTMLTNSPCLLYTSPSPRDRTRSRMPSSA